MRAAGLQHVGQAQQGCLRAAHRERRDDLMRKHANVSDNLAMTVVLSDEYHSIDGQRLANCAAAFASGGRTPATCG